MELIKECTYGSACYRRNKQHFLETSHPFVEEIATKIKNGEIEFVMSLELNPVLLEQAQLVAELMENGEMIPDDQKRTTTDSSGAQQGVKRIASPDIVLVEEPEDDCQHKHKKLKISLVTKDTETTASTEKTSIADMVEASAPFRYFLSSVNMIPETHNQPLTLNFSDLLDPSLGVLEESLQVNFMVELGWLLAQYCQHKVQRKPLLVIYGIESEEMASASSRVPSITTIRVKPKYPYGSHHTKMCLMSYKDGSLRIVVHTGNLIESDWEDRTQGAWVSPSCPPMTSEAIGEGDSLTGFKRDLLRYFETYSLPALQPWLEKIRRADMSAINVCFIPSSPGSHQIHPNSNDKTPKWGHTHLSWLLQQHASVEPDDSIVMQISSIGSLGPSPSSWLLGELAVSMASASSGVQKLGQPSVQVIYPSLQDVKSSLHGMDGGGCLPYSRQGHNKQQWFTGYLHKWRSEARLRTKAMPHIKSYVRVSSDLKRASWFVLTSSNLSKAAWGMRTNRGATLMIQSFEAGILFLPKFVNGEKSFELGRQLVLPYDLPLTKYGTQDEPWFIDQMR